MKVSIISANAYPLFNSKCKSVFGGSELQMYTLANALTNKNIDVEFFVADYKQQPIEYSNKIKIVKMYSLKSNNIKYISGFLRQIKFFLKLIKTNSDVCIQRAAGIETGIVALYCKLFNKKFIYMTAHKIDCDNTYIKKNGIIGKIFKYGLFNAHKIVCQSLEQKILIKKNYNIHSEIIPNSFTINRITSLKRSSILWVSRLDHWKQPEKIIRFAKKHKNFNFVMIAPTATDSNYAKKIYSSAKLAKNIKLIKRVPIDKIASYFSSAKVFINTSIFEGFPNTFVQAAISKTPIISLNVNPDNFLEKYNCGYCSNGNINLLSKQLIKLTTDKKMWNKMSENVYNYAKKNHDLEKNILKLISLF